MKKKSLLSTKYCSIVRFRLSDRALINNNIGTEQIVPHQSVVFLLEINYSTRSRYVTKIFNYTLVFFFC